MVSCWCGQPIAQNVPPKGLEKMPGEAGDHIVIWHFQCEAGHGFHAARRESDFSAVAGIDPFRCNCPAS